MSAPGTPRTLTLEFETAVLSKFFYATNAPCAKRPTSTKPCKNQCETHFGASAHRSKFEAKSICQHFRFRLVTRTPSRASWELSQRHLERLWDCPGTQLDGSWPLVVHPGVPRSVLGRHLRVQKPSRTRPEESPKRFWTPRTAQDRLFVDFGMI